MKRYLFLVILTSSLFAIGGCRSRFDSRNPDLYGESSSSTEVKSPPIKDGFVVSKEGIEKQEPKLGKSNIQGQVLFNGVGVPNIEVRLCEKFNVHIGCSGKQFEATTNSAGEYLIENAPPGEYESLMTRVFQTRTYVFATRKFGASAAGYRLEPDTTFFAPDTNLYKTDLEINAPSPNQNIKSKGFEVKWKPYEGADYYKVRILPKDPGTASPYTNQRSDTNSLVLEKQMQSGQHDIKVEAFNQKNIKIAESKLFSISIGN